MSDLLHSDITQEVLGAAFEVHRALGPGFLESLYEEALAYELNHRRLPYRRQVDVPVMYKGSLVGTHRLDLLVAGKVVIELKTVTELADIHTAIVLSYLSAAELDIGLLLNFSKRSLQFKRIKRKLPAK